MVNDLTVPILRRLVKSSIFKIKSLLAYKLFERGITSGYAVTAWWLLWEFNFYCIFDTSKIVSIIVCFVRTTHTSSVLILNLIILTTLMVS